MVTKLEKPSVKHAQVLNKIFNFNPRDECVASGAHSRKKKFDKKKSPKQSVVTVVVMKHFSALFLEAMPVRSWKEKVVFLESHNE